MGKKIVRVPTDVEPRQEEFERKRGVTGIVVDDGLVHIVVKVNSDIQDRLEVLRALSEAGVNLFLFKFHPDGVHFAIRKDSIRKVKVIMKQLQHPTKIVRDCAMVSVLSSAMRDLPGVMARIAETIHEGGVELLETGDSHDSVMLLMHRSECYKVTQALKKKFGL